MSVMNIDYINQTVGAALNRREADLRSTLEGMGENPSTKDMLLMQQSVQMWTLLVNLQSTIVKEMSEAMKGVIQRAG